MPFDLGPNPLDIGSGETELSAYSGTETACGDDTVPLGPVQVFADQAVDVVLDCRGVLSHPVAVAIVLLPEPDPHAVREPIHVLDALVPVVADHDLLGVVPLVGVRKTVEFQLPTTDDVSMRRWSALALVSAWLWAPFMCTRPRSPVGRAGRSDRSVTVYAHVARMEVIEDAT